MTDKVVLFQRSIIKIRKSQEICKRDKKGRMGWASQERRGGKPFLDVRIC
jgi:hypothetical protein